MCDVMGLSTSEFNAPQYARNYYFSPRQLCTMTSAMSEKWSLNAIFIDNDVLLLLKTLSTSLCFYLYLKGAIQGIAPF